MAQVIRRYLDYAKEPCDPLLVEAGTGVGKSFAYLVAVCEWLKKEKKNNPKVKAVIATHTLALEDQLIKKDVPVIKGLYPTLCFEKAQGRTNYVCRHKLEQLTGGGLFADQNDQYEQLLDWLAHTQSGDRTELTFNPGSIWNQICSGTDCLGASCPHRQGCYYQEMKEKILAADIIVTTHAMVMSDLVVKSLPEYQVLVLDEAHNIEKSAFSAGTTSVNLSAVLNAIEKPLTKSFCHAALKRSRMVNKIRQWQKETRAIAETFFMEVKDKIQSHSLRLHKPCFDPGLASAIEIGVGFLNLAYENVDIEVIKAETAAVIDELGSLASAIRTFVSMDNDGYVYWIDSNGINYCPVDVSTFLKPLFDSKVSVLTSATLTVAGSFESFKKSIGLNKAYSCKYNNSFDYKNNSIVYVPPGAPSPKEKSYIKHAIKQVSTILRLTKGKTFVLFTSYQMMTEVYQEVHALLGDDFMWLVQGTDTKERLLQAYRSSSNAVLFGVDSYWEGIDEDINCVVITKMPFAVPTNPIEEAQYELLKSRGGNPFIEKAIPQCAIKLKQGTGRLIRHKQKRGAVVILDPRINCNWGHMIKKSLPFTTWTEDISIMQKYI